MTHEAGHVEATGDIPPELIEILGAGAAQILAGTSSTTQEPVVFMGPITTPVTHTPTGRVDGIGGIRRGGEVVDDVLTVSEATSLFYAFTDAELRDFQERAFAAGLYGTTDRSQVRFGDPTDGATFNLWVDRVEAAAGFYNGGAGRKVTPWDALDLAQRGAVVGDTEAPRVFSPSVSNPDDLVAIFRETTKEALGQSFSDEELTKMASAFQAKQVAAQRQEFDAVETGGTSVAAPDPRSFADEQAQRKDPVAYDAYRALDKFSVLLETFGGSNG